MGDALSDYMNAISRIPLLTPAEEVHLATIIQRWQQDPQAGAALERRGRRALRRMVEGNLRLVVSICKRYQNMANQAQIEMLDLIQAGSIGLIRAVRGFDPGRGYKFSTYGYWWIRQSIRRAIDQTSRMIRQPIHLADLQRKLRGIIRQHLQSTATEPTLAELAEAAGEPIERVRQALIIDQRCCSLDTRVRQQDGCELSELLASDGPTPDDTLDQQEHLDGMREAIARAMGKMTPAQQQVIARRFGLHGGEQETLAAIGADMGITRERVRQHEMKAMAILKAGTLNARALLRD